MTEIIKREVCKCENCGNEAEMIISCSLPPENNAKTVTGIAAKTDSENKVKGSATCTQCGNEAEIWVDF